MPDPADTTQQLLAQAHSLVKSMEAQLVATETRAARAEVDLARALDHHARGAE